MTDDPIRMSIDPTPFDGITPGEVERIYTLWDELADFEVGATLAARQHLQTVLCDLTDTQNSDWIGVVRMSDKAPNDPMLGWRPRSFSLLHSDPETVAMIAKAFQEMDAGGADPTSTRNAAMAGSFRVMTLDELAPPGWYDSRNYQKFYVDLGRSDSMWTGIPINADAEIQIGLHRGIGMPKITQREKRIAGFCLRGLRWFHRNQMMSEGIGVASDALTPTERRVLRGLLQGLTEKSIADKNRQSPHTTHDHVKRIFRKYGVSSRSELMALWLGSAA